jgi:hypothetical protein
MPQLQAGERLYAILACSCGAAKRRAGHAFHRRAPRFQGEDKKAASPLGFAA